MAILLSGTLTTLTKDIIFEFSRFKQHREVLSFLIPDVGKGGFANATKIFSKPGKIRKGDPFEGTSLRTFIKLIKHL